MILKKSISSFSRVLQSCLINSKCSKLNLRTIYSTASTNSSTIYALSSGAGKCGVAVIRLSGPQSSYAVQKLCGKMTKSRTASLCKLMNPSTKELLDKALVLWFPGDYLIS